MNDALFAEGSVDCDDSHVKSEKSLGGQHPFDSCVRKDRHILAGSHSQSEESPEENLGQSVSNISGDSFFERAQTLHGSG